MRVGDIIEVKIDGQGMDGEGVARHDGVVVFVPYTLVGEVVKCKVTMLKKSFAQAKVIKLVTASKHRVEPQCSAYFKCGGCDFLHINPSAHAKIKTDDILSNFKKIGGEAVVLNEYVQSDKMTGYRNKVQLPFGVVAGEPALGYYANKSHEIAPHERCALHGDWADKLSKIVLNFVKKHQISVYNERTGLGLLRHLVMRKIGDVIAIVLVINGNSVPRVDSLVLDIQKETFKFNLHYNINKQNTNVIVSDKMVTVYGEDTIKAEILGVKAEVSPLSFMQINDFIRDKIYLKATQLISPCNVAIDLYSGVGITSNILAKYCNKVYSIEIVKDAVDNAKILALKNGNQIKITAICGDVAQELPKLLNQLRQQGSLTSGQINAQDVCSGTVSATALKPKNNQDINSYSATVAQELPKLLNQLRQQGSLTSEQINAQHVCGGTVSKKEILCKTISMSNAEFAVLIDPPRKGCDSATINALLQALPDKIVYISCNHATLARDYALLKTAYNLTHLSAYDMFPNTHHIETLVCLTAK